MLGNECQHEQAWLRWAEIRNLIDGSVPNATSGYIAVTAFAKAVQKYQFGHYDGQCLRRGAKFDSPQAQNSIHLTATSAR